MEYTLTNHVEWLPNQGWDSRIHIAANGDLVNVFVVITERYVVIVDTLLNPTTADALLQHAKTYLPGRQILVVNTHADWDHAWGNQLFAGPTARIPAPIIARVECANRFDTQEALDTLRKMQSSDPDIFADVILTKPTLTFRHELIIDGGDLTLRLFPTLGHTPDHIAIYMPEIRTLLAGDAAEIPFPMPYSAADLPILRQSLQTMADLDARHAFYCHAPPEVGPRLIHDNIAYYNALEIASRAALTRGINLSNFPNAELPAVVGCLYNDVAPTAGAWADVSTHARTERHGEQLRMMLSWSTHNAN